MKVSIRPLLLLVVLPLLAGLPALWAGFSFDDIHSIAENPHLRRIENVPRFFVDPSCFSSNPLNRMYRPVLLTSYAINHAIGGGEPWSWHLVNVALHLLVVQLLYRLLLRCVPGRPGLALGVAASFSVHPLHVELIGHVSSRSDLLLALFCAGALLLLARDLSRRNWGHLVGAWVLFTLGLLSKEPALLLPAAGLPVLWCVPGALPGRGRRLALGLGPMLLLGGAWLVLRRHLLGMATAALPRWSEGVDPLSGWGRDLSTQLSSQLVALGRGVELVIFPWRLSADHQIPLVSSPLAGPALMGASLLVVLGGGLFLLGRPRRLGAAGLWWIALYLAPVVLLPLNQLFAEHRLYAPGLGLALALAAAAQGVAGGLGSRLAWLDRAIPRGPALGALGLALLVSLAARSFHRTLDWRDPGRLWAATLRTDPGSFRAWSELGQFRAWQGDVFGALECFRNARRIHPRNAHLALNQIEYAVRVFEESGEMALLQEALELAEESVSRAPWRVEPRKKLCRVHLARARAGGAPPAGCPHAARAVEAAFSGLTFTSHHPAQLAVVALVLEGAGAEEALDPFWAWAQAMVPLDGDAWRQRLEQLVRLGRAKAAAGLLGSYEVAAGPGADPQLSRRIRSLAGVAPAKPPR